MEDPQEDLLVVHCFCVCGSVALLGDLFGVSRSVKCEILFVLSYSRFILGVFFCNYWVCFDGLLYYVVFVFCPLV